MTKCSDPTPVGAGSRYDRPSRQGRKRELIVTVSDFIDVYAGPCGVEWCDRESDEHAPARPHQRVLAHIWRAAPDWRGGGSVVLQPIMYGAVEDELHMGFTLIDDQGRQISILVEDQDVDHIMTALAEYRLRKKLLGRD